MEDKKIFNRNRNIVRILLLLAMIFLMVMAFVIIPNNMKQGVPPIDTTDVDTTDTAKLIDVDNLSEEYFDKDSCDIKDIKKYNLKYLDVITNNRRFYTVEPVSYVNYTKNITVSGHINDIWLCIIADISDYINDTGYKKDKAYKSMVYLRFSDEDFGYLDTAYYKEKGNYYDSNSDNDTLDVDIFGKFFTSDTPKRFIINLNKVLVADKEKGGYKYIYPIRLFNIGSSLQIGGFMANPSSKSSGVGSISHYRLIYNGDGEIKLK